jgi:hypothetical protein
MADRRIAKAAHPIINAWRCHVDNVLYQGKAVALWSLPGQLRSPRLDNDDDGESAAGGRLAHLLQILVSHLLLWPIVPFEYIYRMSGTCWSSSLDILVALYWVQIGSNISTKQHETLLSWVDLSKQNA